MVKNEEIEEFKLQELVSYHLMENEEIIWVGRPVRGYLFKAYGCFGIPFLLTIPIFFIKNPLEYIIPLLIILFFRFFLHQWYLIKGSKIRGNTIYAITNERIIRQSLSSPNLALSYGLGQYEFILCHVNSKGIGTIRINHSKFRGNLACFIDRFLLNPAISSMRKIPNANNVYNILSDSIEKHKNLS